MDDKSIIERNTFEVFTYEEDCPYAFICDKRIAPAIATLNKKGYVTFASCAGHYKNEFYEGFGADISKLEMFKNKPRIFVTEIKKNSFDYIRIVDKTKVYILFKEKYEFDNLPENFVYEDSDDRSYIWTFVSFYDENDKKKERKIIEEEIEEKCKLLNEWAKQLPNRKGMIL